MRLNRLGDQQHGFRYFAGHGIHNGGEKWLLSNAPRRSGEAVNVRGSEYLARTCGIPHVVFISDACRTAPDSIRATAVTGTEIFPNLDGDERGVDQFFACAKGKPALEVRDPADSAGEFGALYTEVLAECLEGRHPDILDVVMEGGRQFGLVRPWKLIDHLVEEVPQRLKAKLGRVPRINQTPVAIINSRDAWLSRVEMAPSRGVAVESHKFKLPKFGNIGMSASSVSEELVATAIAGDRARWSEIKSFMGVRSDTSALQSTIEKLDASFGPDHFETSCGFKIRGARARAVYYGGADGKIIDADHTLIRMFPHQAGVTSALIELSDGTGVVLPVIHEFLAELTFETIDDDMALIDVRYEPSATSPRWGAYNARRGELRALASTIAAATDLGIFRLTAENALELARRMQISKGIDPSMAVYAAYAYHDLHQTELIKQMQKFMHDDLGVVFYDLVLLSGGASKDALGGRRVKPAFPLLSQGWSLLSAFQVRMPDQLRGLEAHLRPSLWTLFDAEGVLTLRAAIAAGEL
jgi:hypothetical protein